MLKRKRNTENVFVVGEHGPRLIPVLEVEADYENIKQEASSVLKRIKQWTPNARNLATGDQLARLVTAFNGEEPAVLCISKTDPDFSNLSITWPYFINQGGVGKKVELKLNQQARNDLETLLKARSAK